MDRDTEIEEKDIRNKLNRERLEKEKGPKHELKSYLVPRKK